MLDTLMNEIPGKYSRFYSQVRNCISGGGISITNGDGFDSLGRPANTFFTNTLPVYFEPVASDVDLETLINPSGNTLNSFSWNPIDFNKGSRYDIVIGGNFTAASQSVDVYYYGNYLCTIASAGASAWRLEMEVSIQGSDNCVLQGVWKAGSASGEFEYNDQQGTGFLIPLYDTQFIDLVASDSVGAGTPIRFCKFHADFINYTK